MPTATSSGADAGGDGGRNRQHNQGNQDRKCTEEQKAAVLRIRRCKATAFYDILGLETVRQSCTDSDIKRAYRKLSLLTHPDKNGHEHADEAFKMVSRAFSILGDKDKRDKYDRFGTDPDSRFSSAEAQNPFAGFASRARGGGGGMGGGMGGGGGGMWEDEVSPEEMFARFFGGGGFGGPFGGFDTGPQFVFNFGGAPGVRVHQFGGARPRRRPRETANGQQQDASITSTIMGLLPILLLFIFPLLSSLFSGSSQPAAPNMAFDSPQPPLYTHERTMPNVKAKYYVNPSDIAQYSSYKLNQLDKTAEVLLVRRLKTECEHEMLHKQRLRESAQGWFFHDVEKLEMAERLDMPSCRRLKKLDK